jgi:outer membrane protein OmpA-like peptidoglycan-associated protein
MRFVMPSFRFVVVSLAIGVSGAQEPKAPGGSWTLYHAYTFKPGSETIVYADAPKAGAVAEYLRRNPTHRVGIDGYSASRVAHVRGALIEAGVPAAKIAAGPVGDPTLRREGRVAVLVGN